MLKILPIMLLSSAQKVAYSGPYAGGFEGVDRTPYFCSLKLILSLNIKY